jgi:hypothetical protein
LTPIRPKPIELVSPSKPILKALATQAIFIARQCGETLVVANAAGITVAFSMSI